MKKIFLIFLMIFLIGCAKNNNTVYINNGKEMTKINVEIADDSAKRTQGLMFREKLDDNAGMLFVFDDERHLSFWMKNTLIPLDMIFISKDLEIVDIKHAAPCKKDPCALYKTVTPAKYVLEVNGNFTIKNNIKINDYINIDKIQNNLNQK